VTPFSAFLSIAYETSVDFLSVSTICLGFTGGNFANTQLGEESSHSPSPVSLCLKSGAFSFL